MASCSDPHHFNADMNPAFAFDADPDLVLTYADPDPTFHFYSILDLSFFVQLL